MKEKESLALRCYNFFSAETTQFSNESSDSQRLGKVIVSQVHVQCSDSSGQNEKRKFLYRKTTRQSNSSFSAANGESMANTHNRFKKRRGEKQKVTICNHSSPRLTHSLSLLLRHSSHRSECKLYCTNK